MKSRLLIIFSFFISVARAQQVYFGLGSHRVFFSPGNIHIRGGTQPAFDFTLYNVRGKDEGGLKFDTAPQFSYFIGYYFKKLKFGLEYNYDHGKYFTRENQVVRIKGFIEDRYYDTDTTLSPGFFRLEHSDGSNYAMINFVKWISVASRVELILKAGAGLVHPKTNSTIIGQSRDDRYHFSGYVTGIETGLRVHFLRHYYIGGSFKGCYASYNDFLISGGKGEQSWFSAQLNYFVGARVDLK
jgi:hypothetical protein